MINTTKLDCGIKVIYEQINTVHSCTIGYWVNAGSVTETIQENGISHFIEHMLFKGTEKRSAKQISIDTDRIGAQINAFTSKENTCFYIKSTDENISEAVDLLSDIFINSVFDENELDRERGVIAEEISMYNDTPDDLVHEVCTTHFFNGSELSKSILGPVENIRSFTSSDLRKYFSEHYQIDNIIISVVGNFNESFLISLLNKYFSANKFRNDIKTTEPGPFEFNNTEQIFTDRDIEQMHISIAYPGLAYIDKRKYSLSILNNIFGGSVSSRLFQKIREEEGLVYSVYSYPGSYYNTGAFYIYAGTSPANKDKVITEIDSIIKDIVKNGISREEFDASKKQYKGNLIISNESTSSKMMTMGKMFLKTGRILTEDEELEFINNTDFLETNDLISFIFNNKHKIISLVGNNDFNNK